MRWEDAAGIRSLGIPKSKRDRVFCDLAIIVICPTNGCEWCPRRRGVIIRTPTRRSDHRCSHCTPNPSASTGQLDPLTYILIPQSLENVLQNLNKLNRSLEGVIAVCANP